MSISSIQSKIRRLIDDPISTHTDIFRYDGLNVLTLTEPNIEEIVETTVNAESSGFSSTFNANTNKITLDGTFILDDLIEVTYSCYLNYSDSQLLTYINNALDYLSIYLKPFILETSLLESATTIIIPTPSFKEESLIAIISAILINPQNKILSLPDVKITPAEKLSTDQIIQRQIALFKGSNDTEAFGVI